MKKYHQETNAADGNCQTSDIYKCFASTTVNPDTKYT